MEKEERDAAVAKTADLEQRNLVVEQELGQSMRREAELKQQVESLRRQSEEQEGHHLRRMEELRSEFRSTTLEREEDAEKRLQAEKHKLASTITNNMKEELRMLCSGLEKKEEKRKAEMETKLREVQEDLELAKAVEVAAEIERKEAEHAAEIHRMRRQQEVAADEAR